MVISHRRQRPRPTTRRRTNYRSDAHESIGPLGEKVRGTANQIAERYQQLARDIVSQDFTLAQNYYQHAEHYLRLGMSSFEDGRSSAQQSSQNLSSRSRNHSRTQSYRGNLQGQPQPDVNGSRHVEFDENPDMQSILPPTIPPSEERWPKSSNVRRRRFQSTSHNEQEDES